LISGVGNRQFPLPRGFLSLTDELVFRAALLPSLFFHPPPRLAVYPCTSSNRGPSPIWRLPPGCSCHSHAVASLRRSARPFRHSAKTVLSCHPSQKRSCSLKMVFFLTPSHGFPAWHASASYPESSPSSLAPSPSPQSFFEVHPFPPLSKFPVGSADLSGAR